MFEKASRLKLRFDSPLGPLTVEDVWELPLLPGRGKIKAKACLDDMAKMLHRELKSDDSESFVLKTNRPNEVLKLKFDIVKHIIDVRLQEEEAVKNAQAAKEKKARIMEIIAEKEDESLKGKSLEDLRGLLDSL